MKHFKENNGESYDNPHLLKAGFIAALGGLLIYSLIAWIGLLLIHR